VNLSKALQPQQFNQSQAGSYIKIASFRCLNGITQAVSYFQKRKGENLALPIPEPERTEQLNQINYSKL
jgi:hypothetical protein